MDIPAIAALAPVIPVLTVERVADAVPLARALVRGGLPALEITLRTPAAVEALAAIAAEVEGAVVGAGTVLNRVILLGCDYYESLESIKSHATEGLPRVGSGGNWGGGGRGGGGRWG